MKRWKRKGKESWLSSHCERVKKKSHVVIFVEIVYSRLLSQNIHSLFFSIFHLILFHFVLTLKYNLKIAMTWVRVYSLHILFSLNFLIDFIRFGVAHPSGYMRHFFVSWLTNRKHTQQESKSNYRRISTYLRCIEDCINQSK
jgi:hypothetical protein